MGYDNYQRGNRQDDYYRSEMQDYGRDYGSGREGSFSSARDHRAAGAGDRDLYRDQGREYDGGRSTSEYRGSYGSDGRRFENYSDREHSRDRTGRDERDTYARRADGRDRSDRARSQDQDDRGFIARAGDEVRSWFGDEDAERRRRVDEQRDTREAGRHGRDFGRDHDDYHQWRSTQIAALDRDYDEYRQHNRTKFHSEFGQWRTQRQGQRDQMAQAKEHQEIVGSDGKHIGTVDHVRDDRILLTKNDQDAGGRHHSIPSSWIQSVTDKVTISKTADEAKRQWRDEENNQALFGGQPNANAAGQANAKADGGTTLNKSFSGTY